MKMGLLKERMHAMVASNYTPRDAAKVLGTTVATVYALSARYNINFKQAGWGEYKRAIDNPPKA
jgi:transposase